MTFSNHLLKKAIFKTLTYSSLFEFPLTPYEVFLYLIELKTDFTSVKLVLEKYKEICKKDSYFFVKTRTDVIKKRKIRKNASRAKWEIVRKTVHLLSVIPTIQFIGVTGGLAMNNADSDDDIDFLIITSPGFLWITRFFSTILLDLFGIRRKPQQNNVKDLICLNMFLDNHWLSIDTSDQNIYSAHEVLQMKPVLNKNYTYEYFLIQNKWVKNFLPNLWNTKRNEYKLSSYSFNRLLNFLTKIMSPVEFIFYKFQLEYMKNKITKEKVNLFQIQFHPGNLKGDILSKYHKALDRK